MCELTTVLHVTGLSVDDLLHLKRPLSPEEREAIGVSDDRAYLRAFRYGFEIGDQFFPRTPPSGDYMLGWNHGGPASWGKSPVSVFGV
jgi:hypothetical protein